MNKKKSLVLILFMVVVLTLTTCMLVACNSANEAQEEKTETVDIEATENLTISNSDFKVVSSLTKYPATITDWTGSKLYSSGSYPDDVIAGAINLTKETYDANKATWNDSDDALYNLLVADNHYSDADEIKNALLIYMPATDDDDDDTDYGPTAYGFTSSTFSLEKAKYYKLSVEVLTKDIAGTTDESTTSEPGARIYVSSNTYAEFAQINTNGVWKTYNVYIEASKAAATSLTINLSLGKYTSAYTYGLTSGYVVFDNLTLEEINETAYKAEVTKEEENQDNYRLTNQTNTLLVNNGRFDYGTTTLGYSSAPSNWSVVTGNSSDDDPAPTSKGYNAIIDASKFESNYSNYSSTYYFKKDGDSSSTGIVLAKNLEAIKDSVSTLDSKTIGSNVYMLSQQLMTAQGLKSSKQITIEKNKTYALSVNVYTYAVHGAGVSLILSGSDSKDIVIEGISKKLEDKVYIGSYEIDTANKSYIADENLTYVGETTGGWKTYTFYITGNPFYDYSYNLTIWLGTKGTNSNNSISYTKYASSSESTDTTYKANGTFANGWVFMDDVKLNEIDSTAIPTTGVQAVSVSDPSFDVSTDTTINAIKVELTSSNELAEGNLLDSNKSSDDLTKFPGVADATVHGNPLAWNSSYDYDDTTAPVVQNLINIGLVDIQNEGAYNSSFKSTQTAPTYPNMPYALKATSDSQINAFMISASKDSFYQINTDTFTIKANATYRLSFWVKTVDVKSTSGFYASLMKKVEDGDDTSLSSIDCVNSNDIDDDYTNDWVEFTFYICGANEEDTILYLQFALGTGTRWSASTLTSGAAFVTSLSLVTTTYEAFGDATTGTYTKSVDMSSSYTYTFTNGSFDEYDKDAEGIDASKALKDNTIVGDPNSWTFNDLTLKSSKLIAGTIQLEKTDKAGKKAGDTGVVASELNGLYYGGSDQTTSVLPSIDFTSIYGTKSDDANYLSPENLTTIAGPYMLALAYNSTGASDLIACGYASNSFTLSANTTYQLSVYAKTYGETVASIFLTGEASGTSTSNYFTIENTSDTGWVKYTYYIEVGQTSVSPKLNLWLGTDKDYVGEKQTAGTVLFDNIVLKSIDKDDIPGSFDPDTEKYISFTVDGFDALSSTSSARESLSTPASWTASVDTNQTSSNTKGGVIYADTNYLAKDSEGFITILGATVDEDDYTEEKCSDEINAKKEEKGSDLTNEEIAAVKKAVYLKDKTAVSVTIDDLTPKSGKQMLVINNTTTSAYMYTGSSITLSANTYYAITVYVRTLKLNETTEAGAYIQLNLGDAEEDDNPMIFKAIKADSWTPYKFYVETLDDSVSSVQLKLALGKYYEQAEDADSIPSLTSGYAFFDDVSIEEIDATEYSAATESATLLKRTVELAEEGTADDDEEDPGESSNTNKSFNLEYLWWMIPTIILGLLTIIVVIVWVVKKIKSKQPKKAQIVEEASNVSEETIDEIRSKYDSNKE